MIKAKDAIAAARALEGTPYSTYDCIGLIVQIIRRSPGGVKDYRCQGTNWLWDSIGNSGKYRHLTWRQEGTSSAPSGHLPQRGRLDAQAGMLAFKRTGSDVHHVGLVTGEGTVIHSSSAKGCVVETALDGSWDLLGMHRYIETSSVSCADTFPKGEGLTTNKREATDMESYTAQVVLEDADSVLNVRNEPGPDGDVIGRIGHGAQVTVQAEFENGWRYVTYGESGIGYVSGEYLDRIEEGEEPENIITVSGDATIIDDAGNTFRPIGGWRVVFGGVD